MDRMLPVLRRCSLVIPTYRRHGEALIAIIYSLTMRISRAFIS